MVARLVNVLGAELAADIVSTKLLVVDTVDNAPAAQHVAGRVIVAGNVDFRASQREAIIVTAAISIYSVRLSGKMAGTGQRLFL